MSPLLRTIGFIYLLLLGLTPVSAHAVEPRVVLQADAGWKFVLGDPSAAETPSYADAAWRTVDLPHDWSIERPPAADYPSGSGGGFYPTGVAWYRKTFRAPAEWRGKRASVEFDGVYRNATVYLNGRKLGTHPYGYTSFAYDLTPGLQVGGRNTLAVRVDNSAQPNSRWYSGSGIYRHVRVVVTDPTHIAQWGVFVTTPKVSPESALVAIQTKVTNESSAAAKLMLETTLYNAAGTEVGMAMSPLTLAPGIEQATAQTIAVTHPSEWSPAAPVLYRAVSRIRRQGHVVDETQTPFGMRTLVWSAEKGLQLNGKPIKLTGGSVHHDNGPLGAAAFDRAEERRVELLKAAGYNAVRTAHNPPSPAFLDACDRLGLLVLDEAFDTWKAHKVKYDYGADFNEWWRSDISSMVLRDRNHPSVVIWSIGNEIPELTVERGPALAKQLADQVRSLDTTRPLTLAFPGNTTAPNAAAAFSVLDITGYNYNLVPTYAADHQKIPARLMLTTESFPAKAFPLWQISQANPYVIGDFTWTAMDYLGESGIGAWSYGTAEQLEMAQRLMGGMMTTDTVDKMFLGMAHGIDMTAATANEPSDPAMKAALAVLSRGFPWHGAVCGDLDLTGYRKPQSYYRDIVWNGGDRVYVTVRLPPEAGKQIIAVGWATYPTLASWNWPGEEDRELQVEVYSGAEKVRLYLNDQLIGEKPTGAQEEFKAVFSVPYHPGTLKAVAVRGDQAVAEHELTTAASAAKLRLTADRSIIEADGQDLSFIEVAATDAEGRLQPQADQDVQFSISGPGIMAAVGNGDAHDEASYQSDHRRLLQGRALVIVRASQKAGPIVITASSPGLDTGSVTLQTKAAPARAELP